MYTDITRTATCKTDMWNKIISAERGPMSSGLKTKFEKQSSLQEAKLMWNKESETLGSSHIELKFNYEERERVRYSSDKVKNAGIKYYNWKYVDTLMDSPVLNCIAKVENCTTINRWKHGKFDMLISNKWIKKLTSTTKKETLNHIKLLRRTFKAKEESWEEWTNSKNDEPLGVTRIERLDNVERSASDQEKKGSCIL
jgi:hypothetical protein